MTIITIHRVVLSVVSVCGEFREREKKRDRVCGNSGFPRKRFARSEIITIPRRIRARGFIFVKIFLLKYLSPRKPEAFCIFDGAHKPRSRLFCERLEPDFVR